MADSIQTGSGLHPAPYPVSTVSKQSEECAADQLPACSAKVQKTYSYVAIPPHTLWHDVE